MNKTEFLAAIYGDPFFTAGSKAFHKLMSNSLRVFTINTIGDAVLFLGKVFVVVITVLTGIEMLRAKDGLHHMWVPLALAGIFAYLISHCFITVYEVKYQQLSINLVDSIFSFVFFLSFMQMIIDTIFLCFCEDCEMNDGVSRPYFMSMSLMDFVNNSKKVLGIRDGA